MLVNTIKYQTAPIVLIHAVYATGITNLTIMFQPLLKRVAVIKGYNTVYVVCAFGWFRKIK